MFFSDLTLTRLCANYRAKALIPTEGEKNHKKGGLNFFFCVLKNCSQVQRKKEHKQLYRFLPQTRSSYVPLSLPRRVPLKCNIKLQVAQSHKKETSLCSRTTPRDFYAQSHLKETSMLKDNSKRLPLLNHT